MGLSHVAVVAAVFVFAAVTVSAQIPTLVDRLGQTFIAIYLPCFYFFYVLTVISYTRATTASPGRPKDLVEGTAASPYMRLCMDAKSKPMRKCTTCKCNKPERTHHCGDCNACTLKMDHHCPWVNNCIGFWNYKYFFLLLVYATISELMCIALLVLSLVKREGDAQLWDYVSYGCIPLVGLFAIGTVGLALFHTSLLLANQTTIEQIGKKDTYDIGTCNNVRQVLGSNCLIWCLPFVWGVADEYDGVNWDDPATRPALPTSPDGVELEMSEQNSEATGAPPYAAPAAGKSTNGNGTHTNGKGGSDNGVRGSRNAHVPIVGENLTNANALERRVAQLET